MTVNVFACDHSACVHSIDEADSETPTGILVAKSRMTEQDKFGSGAQRIGSVSVAEIWVLATSERVKAVGVTMIFRLIARDGLATKTLNTVMVTSAIKTVHQ